MPRYKWAAMGDFNAFFGLMLDNIAVLVLMVGLLAEQGFPANFAVSHLIPGTALGVLLGDLMYTFMAFRLAYKTNNPNVTAMPLGLDLPSAFGMVFFVLGPAFHEAQSSGESAADAAIYAWHIGVCALLISGVFKLACAGASGWVRRVLPRAGLLGSLAGIALVLIAFMPLLEVMRYPVVGFASLAVILTTLVARLPLPLNMPGALGALIVGGTVYYLMLWTGTLGAEIPEAAFKANLGWELHWPGLAWLNVLDDSLKYLPVVLPFALATVVGGIDCTESAAAVGDEYHTGAVIAVEGVSTLVAGLFGGVIQSTPYIGHPAYKAMGGRAAYTLATALFIGGAGLLGYFSLLYVVIPKAAVFPILIFIGLEITAQSYHATPPKHFAAVAIACIPALAYLVLLWVDQSLAGMQVYGIAQVADQNPELAVKLQTLRILSGGFIITSLLWASALAALIDHKLTSAAMYFAIGAPAALFGVIHSPLPGSRLVNPWSLPESLPAGAIAGQSPIYIAGAYALTAALLFGWQFLLPVPGEAESNDSAANSPTGDATSNSEP